MPTIKRYPNRKLYDTEAKQYITLEGIADLIRQGEEVQVVDNATGEDMTAVTLTQIIFEQEKKQAGFLPQTVLTGLVQAGGDTLGSLQRRLASSLGLLRQVDAEIEQRIQALISQNELAEAEGRRLIDKLLAQSPWAHEPKPLRDQDIEQAISKHPLPTRNDLKQLAEQIDALTAKLDNIDRSKAS